MSLVSQIYILNPFLRLVLFIHFIDLSSKDSPDEDVFFEEGKSLHKITKIASPLHMFSQRGLSFIYYCGF